MALNCIIIGVGDIIELNKHLPNIQENIIDIGGEVSYTKFLLPDKDVMMEQLIYFADNNGGNVIIIFSGPSERNVVSDVIKNVISKNIPEKLITFILNLEYMLSIRPDRSVCGIRNQKLIIGMSGPCIDVAMCLKTNGTMILQAIHLIAESEKTDDNKICSDSENAEYADLVTIKKIQMLYNKSPFLKVTAKDAIDMIKKIIQESGEEVEIETINANDAYGRILCEDIYSKYDVPPCRTAVKHGYAVLASDGKGMRRVLKKQNTSVPLILESGTCVWVKSGTPIPDEATAVIQVENTRTIEIEDDIDDNIYYILNPEKEIEVLIEPEERENIRPIGCEIGKEDKILDKYTRIGIAEMGLLACCGYTDVRVAKIPYVGILSIGDELEEPGETLRPRHVYDSNRITLISLLKENGFESADFGIVPNMMIPVIRRIEEAIEKVDVLVTTGCVNDKDMLKSTLKGYFKATIHFGGVDIKPGKSTTFATCTFDNKKKYFLCLSGNPTTASITARLFLLPFLNELRCYFSAPTVMIPAQIDSLYNLHSRPKYAWTFLKWDEYTTTAKAEDTKKSDYYSGNALLMLPPSTSRIKTAFATLETALYTGATK